MFIDEKVLSCQEITPFIKLFLHSLSDFANDRGVCWPGQRKIAERMSISTRTVQRLLRECVELQLVEVKRRWRKSNIYKLKCLKPKKVIHNDDTGGVSEQPVFYKKTLTPPKPRFVDPKEVSLLLGDIAQVVGPKATERNMRWYQKLIRYCSYESIQSAISFVRSAIAEAQFSDKPISNPSGLMLWFLRVQEGCPI